MTKTIAILLPMVWSVRNIISSGVLEQLLAQGLRIKLLLPAALDLGPLLPANERLEVLPLLKPGAFERVFGYHLLQALRNSAFSHRHGTVRQKKIFAQAAAANTPVKTAWYEPFTQTGGKLLARLAHAETALDDWHARAYQKKFDLRQIEAQLRTHNVDLLFSTVCVDQHEFPYVLAARRLGVRTVTAVLSFDNLTTRGRLPLFDQYLVWNERMQRELRKLYPNVPAEHITITGTPQFDFHVNPQYRWSRAQTLQQLQLPPDARYLLYAANHRQWTPTEPALVQQLADRLATLPTHKDSWIVVRLHPLDDPTRWRHLANSTTRLRICSPWFAATNEAGWAPISVEDQKLLVNSLAHSEMCLNMASTMTLDAAILDKPVIGIAFSVNPGSTEETLYREAYKSLHYRPLVASQGLKLAHSWEELLVLIEGAGQDAAERNARRHMVEQECGQVDGQAAARLASKLQELLTRHATARN